MGAAAIIGIVILLILLVVGGIYASKSSSSTPAPTVVPKPVPKPATGTPAQYASNPATDKGTTKETPKETPVVVNPPASPPAVVTPSAPVNQAPAPTTPTASSVVNTPPPATITSPLGSTMGIVTGPSYTLKTNYDAAGNDIECLHGVTPDVCKTKCDNDGKCLAYNEVKKGIWGPNDFGCCTKKAIVNLIPINNIDFYTKNQTITSTPASTPVINRIPVVDGGYNDGQFPGKTLKKGYYDILGQGVPNDYCRYVGDQPNIFFACQLSNGKDTYAKTYNDKNVTDIISGKNPLAHIRYYMRHNYLHY